MSNNISVLHENLKCFAQYFKKALYNAHKYPCYLQLSYSQ